MFRHLLFAALFALLPLSGYALAVDYDYQAAQARWQVEKRELDAAESELSRQRTTLSQAQQEYSSAVAQLDAITNRLQWNRDRQQLLHRSRSDKQSEVQSNQTRRQDLVRRVDSLNSQIDRIRTQRDAIDRDLREDQRRLQDVERRIRELEDAGQDTPELSRLRTERSNLQSEIESQRRDIRNYDSQIANLHGQVDDHWRNIEAIDATVNRLTAEIRGIDAEISDLEFEEDRLSLDLSRAQNRVADARSARDRAQINFDAAQRSRDVAYQEERQAYAYYEEVLGNYNRAYSAAQSKGQGDGQRDGGREATERASPLATNAGRAAGDTAGNTAGLAAAREIAGVQGYNHGLANGATDGRLTASYRQGQGLGQAWARDEARAEDYPAGYNARMNEVLAVPPTASASYDISTELPEIPAGDGPLLDPRAQAIGSVAAPSHPSKNEPPIAVPAADRPSVSAPSADRRYYAPACAGQPLPVFTQACEQSYQTAYVGGFSSLYQNAYLGVYRTHFDQAADAAYRSARQTSFPEIYLAQAQVGATDGGRLQGYSSSIAVSRQTATADGRRAFDAFRGTGYLLLLRQVQLVDQVVDSVMSPGEGIKVKLVLDNYGLKPSRLAGIRLKLHDLAGGEFQIVLRDLPVFEADTQTTLTGVLTGKVGTLQAQKVKFTAKLELVDGDVVTVVDEVPFEHVIKSPLELSSVRFPAPLVVGREGSAILTWKNATTQPFAAMSLPLALPGDGLTSTATTVALPELAAGASAEVQLPVTATVYAGGNVPGIFEVTATGVAGAGTLVVAAQAPVPVTRNGQLDLCFTRCTDAVSFPLRVTAGSTLRIPAQFSFKGTTRSLFEFGKLGESDNRITAANGSTVRVGPSEWGPGSQPYRADFSYVIPTALRGQTHWVTLYLKERSTTLQVVKIPFIVQ